jgi:hypothetical protein
VSESGPPSLSRLRELAEASDLDFEELRNYLSGEVERRQRATYSMHLRAHQQLDRRLAEIAKPD